VKRSIILCIILILLTSRLWSQFYNQLTDDKRRKLAESYYLAGEKYKSLGKTATGEDYIETAFIMYPGLDPERISAAGLPELGGEPLDGNWQPRFNPLPEGITAEDSVSFYFQKLLRGLFTEDKSAMLTVIDKRLYIQGVNQGIPQPETDANLQYLFLHTDIAHIPPSKIVDMQSTMILPVTQNIWRVEIKYATDPMVDLGAYLPGSSNTLTLFFRVVGTDWKVFAIGTLPNSATQIISPEETIRDTMVSSIQAFTDQNAVEASRYFTDPFFYIPFGKDVTREELNASFAGYFEDTKFSRSGFPSIEFDIAESSDMAHPGGQTYQVLLDFDSEEGKTFPFWESLNGYFLLFDEREGAWKIFAIF